METRIPLVEIDLSRVSSAHELQSVLKESLGFPSFYGMNWNAFWDAITGLVEMPETLRLQAWEDFSHRLPSEARQLSSCLEDMKRQYPSLASNVEQL